MVSQSTVSANSQLCLDTYPYCLVLHMLQWMQIEILVECGKRLGEDEDCGPFVAQMSGRFTTLNTLLEQAANHHGAVCRKYVKKAPDC